MGIAALHDLEAEALHDLEAESDVRLLERAIRTGSTEAVEIVLAAVQSRDLAESIASQLSLDASPRARVGASYALYRLGVTRLPLIDKR